jgi:hypothetical protein
VLIEASFRSDKEAAGTVNGDCNAATKIQNTLKVSLSSAQVTIIQLKEQITILYKNARKSKALIIHYKSRVQDLDKCIADIAATVRRVEK